MKKTLVLAAAMMLAQLSQTQAQQANTIGEKRFDVGAIPTNDAVTMAISPDGKKLVFSGSADGQISLWLKDLDSGDQKPLVGTEFGKYPFWSPDGQNIGFFSDTKLKRLDIGTGKVQILVVGATWGGGGTWNQYGTILYGRQGQFTLQQISDTGGPSRSITQLNGPQQLVHVHPQFLPDGRHFIYYVEGLPSARGIWVGELGGPEGRRLVDSEAAGVYAAGRLLFLDHGTLFAQKFDLLQLVLSDSRVQLAENVPVFGRSVGGFSAGGDNIIYRSGLAGSLQQLTWYDRSGTKLGAVGVPFLTGSGAPSLSPDGKSVVVNRIVDGSGDIWTVDVQSGEFSRFTTDPANDSYPIWFADGQRIAFSSNRTPATGEMYEKPVGVPAVETLLFGPVGGFRHPMDRSRDGRYLIFRTGYPDLWALKLEGFSEIPIIPETNREIRWPQLAPNGRWIAFQSKVTDRNEIYVHGPFDPPQTGQTSAAISTGGGRWVRWSGDGKELFYIAANGALTVVPMEFAPDGRSFKAGVAAALFTPSLAGSPDDSAQQFMVSQDGQRFLVLNAPFESSPIHVIQNWKP